MTDVTPEPLVEKKPKKFSYARDHKKSMRQIASDGYNPLDEKKTEQKEEKSEVLDTAVKPTDVEEEKPVEERKEESKVEPVDTIRVAEEAATKAAEKTSAQFKQELKEIQDSELSKVDKKKAEEELLSIWDKEQRLPTDYKEIFNEAQRIGELKARKFYEEQQQLSRDKQESDKKEAEEHEKSKQEAQVQYEKDLQTRVGAEINELRQAKIIPDQKTEDDFLQFGIKFNTDRVKEGKPPVADITKLFFIHYQPHKATQKAKGEQPAGIDAPIAGSKTSHSTELPTDRYVYARDHKRSFRQIIMESAKRLTGK